MKYLFAFVLCLFTNITHAADHWQTFEATYRIYFHGVAVATSTQTYHDVAGDLSD